MANLLTASELRAHLNYCPETGIFTWKIRTSNRVKIGKVAGGRKPHGYIKIAVAGLGRYYAHRLAWLYVTGDWPKCRLDHRNGNREDNSFKNLREATNQQNTINRPARGTRLTPWGRWTAQLGLNLKSVYLGTFDSEGEAHAAYLSAMVKFHGKEWCTRKEAQ